MRFRSMRVSVNTVATINTILLYVPPKISSSAADYETKNFYQHKKKVARKLSPANSVARRCLKKLASLERILALKMLIRPVSENA
jgi:hypothetical protein